MKSKKKKSKKRTAEAPQDSRVDAAARAARVQVQRDRAIARARSFLEHTSSSLQKPIHSFNPLQYAVEVALGSNGSEESQRLEALFQESDEIATAIALSYVDALIDSANRYADVIEETRWMVTESTHLCARINDCADACESAERTGSRESGGSGSEQPIDRMLEQVNAAMEGELAATVQRNEAALLVLEQVEWVMHARTAIEQHIKDRRFLHAAHALSAALQLTAPSHSISSLVPVLAAKGGILECRDLLYRRISAELQQFLYENSGEVVALPVEIGGDQSTKLPLPLDGISRADEHIATAIVDEESLMESVPPQPSVVVLSRILEAALITKRMDDVCALEMAALRSNLRRIFSECFVQVREEYREAYHGAQSNSITSSGENGLAQEEVHAVALSKLLQLLFGRYQVVLERHACLNQLLRRKQQRSAEGRVVRTKSGLRIVEEVNADAQSLPLHEMESVWEVMLVELKHILGAQLKSDIDSVAFDSKSAEMLFKFSRSSASTDHHAGDEYALSATNSDTKDGKGDGVAGEDDVLFFSDWANIVHMMQPCTAFHGRVSAVVPGRRSNELVSWVNDVVREQFLPAVLKQWNNTVQCICDDAANWRVDANGKLPVTALLCEELEQLVTGLAPLHSCAGEIVRGLEEKITTIFISQCNSRLEKMLVKKSCNTALSSMEIIDLIQSSPLWTSAIGDEVASTGRSLADTYKGSTTPSGRVQHLQRYQSLVERNADALTYAEHLVFGIGFDGEGGTTMVLMDEIQEFRWVLALHNSIGNFLRFLPKYLNIIAAGGRKGRSISLRKQLTELEHRTLLVLKVELRMIVHANLLGCEVSDAQYAALGTSMGSCEALLLDQLDCSEKFHFLASGLARLVSSCVINHACAMAQLHTAEEVIVRLSQCIARAQQNVSLLLNEPHIGASSSQLSVIFRRGKGAVDAIYDVESFLKLLEKIGSHELDPGMTYGIVDVNIMASVVRRRATGSEELDAIRKGMEAILERSS